MSLVASALVSMQGAAARVATFVAAKDDAEFNPESVTPGPAGFIMTAVFAAAVIGLGFLLVTRIRRNQYRHEVREGIEAELADRAAADAGNGAAGGGAAGSGTADAGDAGAQGSDPEAPAGPRAEGA